MGNLVTRGPPSWRSGHEDAGSGPLVTRPRAEMVPREPTSPGTWSPRNHLARCPRTPGPQGTRFCVRMVPRGSTSRATWSLVHHPRRRPRRPGHERTRTWCQAGPQRTIFTRDLVPGAPPCPVLAKEGGRGGSRRTRSCAGLVPIGPGLPATWSCGDHVHSGHRRPHAHFACPLSTSCHKTGQGSVLLAVARSQDAGMKSYRDL